MCAPSGVTDVEKRAVIEASLSAGARRVHLIEEPIAAAIGAGLEIDEPVGNMVVDVGGGTTEVAVISLGGIVVAESIRTGGYELDDAIASYIKREHGLAIGQQTAEDIKLSVGSAMHVPGLGEAEVRGRDLVSGLPKTVNLGADEVREALAAPLVEIMDAIKNTLERTPPELASDVAERGILLAGGGVLLQGFDQRVREETGMPANLADSPLTCVVVGSGRSLEEFEAMQRSGSDGARRSGARRLADRVRN
jgi:rod shape-determining protein MreB